MLLQTCLEKTSFQMEQTHILHSPHNARSITRGSPLRVIFGVYEVTIDHKKITAILQLDIVALNYDGSYVPKVFLCFDLRVRVGVLKI